MKEYNCSQLYTVCSAKPKGTTAIGIFIRVKWYHLDAQREHLWNSGKAGVNSVASLLLMPTYSSPIFYVIFNTDVHKICINYGIWISIPSFHSVISSIENSLGFCIQNPNKHKASELYASDAHNWGAKKNIYKICKISQVDRPSWTIQGGMAVYP